MPDDRVAPRSIDERRGRRAAAKVGVEVVGVLGVVIVAKEQQLLPTIRPQVEAFGEHHLGLDPWLIRDALGRVGEIE